MESKDEEESKDRDSIVSEPESVIEEVKVIHVEERRQRVNDDVNALDSDSFEEDGDDILVGLSELMRVMSTRNVAILNREVARHVNTVILQEMCLKMLCCFVRAKL